MNKIFSIIIMTVMFSGAAWAHEDEKHGVHFITPLNNAIVDDNMHVAMAVMGMGVHKAGELKQGTGHFHVIVDGAFVPVGEVVKKDATHMHFGKGQTETALNLAKGRHTLTLQFADGHHVSYGKAWSKTIHVQVK
ncbi:MAG: DUF4399 domain-containing protein [Mariprofundaceae bacterium]|nr:DUF4399 domain-containing protein [Mariprofundaceae bacterium]